LHEAEGITGIITGAYDLVSDNYFRVLYEIAGDLAPSIVVIEDLDLVAQEREDHGIHTSPLLIALLNILDGLEKTSAVVTVATTNHLEALDKAIRERPSRFDRVIRMELPEFGERKALAALLSRRIPVETGVADLIASETGGCSPAQIQEVFYTMAIGHRCNEQCRQQGTCRFSMEEARTALGFMKKKTRHMGFQSVGFPGREAADVAQPGFGKNRA
jgi:AAA+ superfamily predicted ATPase